MEHKDYLEEKRRLDMSLKEVEIALRNASHGAGALNSSLETLKKKRTTDNSQAFVEMMVSSMLSERAELRIKNLNQAKLKPYFCRVDFTEKAGVKESYYIGKTALLRDEDQNLIIMDWRAPAANLYYDARIGEAKYKSPAGEVEGTLTLKRQIIVEDGDIREIRDIDVTASDDFLQASLGANSEGRLKEIVATIQGEQNEVIRAEMWKPLIVQGAAGSGKTTIALHRMAWLIYNNEKTMKPSNFMILAPNKFFLDYISEVLPELGVDQTVQTTYREFALKILGKLKVAEQGDRLRQLADGDIDMAAWNRNARISGIKGGLAFKGILDKYFEKIENEILPMKDLKIGKNIVCSRNEAANIMNVIYGKLPIEKRMKESKKHFQSKGANLTARLKRSAELLTNEKITKLRDANMDELERQKLAMKIYANRDSIFGQIESSWKEAMTEYTSWNKHKTPILLYKDLFQDENQFIEFAREEIENGTISETDCRELYCETRDVLDTGKVEFEDLAPLLYILHRLTGFEGKTEVKHVVVDEAQDFNLLQLYTLKAAIKDSSFTILGDLAQGLHSYRSIKGWQELNREVFDSKADTLELLRCYRNTIEIMEAAIEYHEPGDDSVGKPEAVLRHGEPIYRKNVQASDELIDELEKLISKWKTNGYNTLAVITATEKQAKGISLKLNKRNLDTKLISEKDGSFIKGAVIVAANLVKGLEFDCAAVVDIGFEVYGDMTLAKRLRYVACTRALHELAIFKSGKGDELFRGI